MLWWRIQSLNFPLFLQCERLHFPSNLYVLHSPPPTTNRSIIRILVRAKHCIMLPRLPATVKVVEEIANSSSDTVIATRSRPIRCFCPVHCHPWFVRCGIATQVLCVNATYTVVCFFDQEWAVIACASDIDSIAGIVEISEEACVVRSGLLAVYEVNPVSQLPDVVVELVHIALHGFAASTLASEYTILYGLVPS